MSGKLIGVNAPVRLLREKWSDATSLAQELYAMFSAKSGPVQLDAPLTIRVPEGQTALRIEQGPAEEIKGSNLAFDRRNKQAPVDKGLTPRATPKTTDPSRRNVSTVADTNRRSGTATARASEATSGGVGPVPLLDIAGPVRLSGSTPVQFTRMPVIVNPATGLSQPLDEVAIKRPSPSGEVASDLGPFFGQVVSGTGPTVVVKLYPQGPDKPPGSTVTVTIPQIAADETWTAGTWLQGILKYGTKYYCQPPVWLP